jgi:hypothetical protein
VALPRSRRPLDTSRDSVVHEHTSHSLLPHVSRHHVLILLHVTNTTEESKEQTTTAAATEVMRRRMETTGSMD